MLNQPHGEQISIALGVKQEQLATTRISTENFLNFLLNNIFPASLELGAAIFILNYSYSWKIGTVVLGLVVFSTTYNFLTGPLISHSQIKYVSDRMASARYVSALWTNFESVYYFNTLGHELGKLKQLVTLAQQSDLNNIQMPEKISFFHSLVIHGSLLGLIIFVGEEYSLRDFSIIVYFLMQIIAPLTNLGESSSKIRAAHQELMPIIGLLNKNFGNTENFPCLNTDVDGGAEVCFDNVSFSYKQNEPLVEGVSFTARAGKTTAIVGLSGGGKSTLIRLLFKLYTPTGGRITIDGQDTDKIDLFSLRNRLSIVPQNPVLFNNTFRYNIAYGAVSLYGNENIPEELIENAVEQAGLSSLVERQPEGLNKKVGENGLMISGGQLLRIAIARAIIRKAPIVVLDEYTSALDSETEHVIQNSMKVALKGVTKIIIAHRLSTIQDADNIVVLDKGRVGEQGTFAELISRNGIFSRLWKRQSQPTSVQEKEGDINDSTVHNSKKMEEKNVASVSSSTSTVISIAPSTYSINPGSARGSNNSFWAPTSSASSMQQPLLTKDTQQEENVVSLQGKLPQVQTKASGCLLM